jgi:glycosyltransferase involved in cell wall biosynthesis
MAAGTPVIALKAGGALDYVIPGTTGEFFTQQTPEALAEVLKNFDSSKYIPEKISAHAETFSTETFHKNITHFISQKMTAWTSI